VDRHGNVLTTLTAGRGLRLSASTRAQAGSPSVCLPGVARAFGAAVDLRGNVITLRRHELVLPSQRRPGAGRAHLHARARRRGSLRSFGPTASTALTYEGRTWSKPVRIDPGAQQASLLSPAASASFCAAVDKGGNAVTYRNGSWSSPAARRPETEAGSPPSPADGELLRRGGPPWQRRHLQRRTWSPPLGIDPGRRRDHLCLLPDCEVLARRWTAASTPSPYDGGTWSKPVTIDPNGGGLRSISCPSASFCAACGLQRQRAHLRCRHVVVPRHRRPGHPLESVSCSSANLVQSRWTAPPPFRWLSLTTTAITAVAPHPVAGR